MSPVRIELPDGPRVFRHLSLDFTGTLSEDGSLIANVPPRLVALSRRLDIIVLTADSFGTARDALAGLPLEVRIVTNGMEKVQVLESLGPGDCIAIGNGRNDVPMLKVAGLSIAVLGPEGLSSRLIQVADVVTRDIGDALDLVLNPLRLKATLRD